MAAAGLAVQDVVGILAKHGQKMGALGDVRGLCAPIDRMALKSSFNNGGRAFSAAVIIPEGLGSAPPRITMRAAAKTAYICQDCGYVVAALCMNIRLVPCCLALRPCPFKRLVNWVRHWEY